MSLSSHDIERRLVGSAIVFPDQIPRVRELISADVFQSRHYRELWQAILAVFDEHGTVDIALLEIELRKRKLETALGELLTLCEEPEAPPLSFAQALYEQHVRRQVASLGSELIEIAQNGSPNWRVIVEKVSAAYTRHLRDIETAGTQPLSEAADVLKRLLDEDPEFERKTGFYALDDIIGGLRPGEMIVLAGRPSTGKTTLALNIALNIAQAYRAEVLFFSLEMTAQQILLNAISALSCVNLRGLRQSDSFGMWWRAILAAWLVHQLPLRILEVASNAVWNVCARIKEAARHRKVGLVVVDYLQLLRGSRKEGRQTEIAEISATLKRTAIETQIPFLVLSQLNRRPESREDHKPMLSDLRESGAIEQDADVAILLYAPDRYDDDATEGVVEVNVAKHRNGPIGECQLFFDRRHLRFWEAMPCANHT